MSSKHPSSSSSSLLATNTNLFGPAPPPFRFLDSLNPNPLITTHVSESVEHFKLMSRGTVEDIRLLGCQIIQSGIKLLKMSHSCLYTAQILFNQFYARESFLDFALMDILMACVFVAGKTEECIRRARDIVNVFHHLYCLIRKLQIGPIDYVGDTYYIWRDRLCTAESLLLRELGFHVQPASPVNLLLSYLKILELDQNENVPQVSLNYLNDSLKTDAYIRFQPRILAVSAISLSLDRLNLTRQLLPDPSTLNSPWYTLFDVNDVELMECKQIIMTVYNRELDTLLPLTKEELNIFASSIRPEIDASKINTTTEKAGKDLRTESVKRHNEDIKIDYSRSSSDYRRRDRDQSIDIQKERERDDIYKEDDRKRGGKYDHYSHISDHSRSHHRRSQP